MNNYPDGCYTGPWNATEEPAGRCVGVDGDPCRYDAGRAMPAEAAAACEYCADGVGRCIYCAELHAQLCEAPGSPMVICRECWDALGEHEDGVPCLPHPPTREEREMERGEYLRQQAKDAA